MYVIAIHRLHKIVLIENRFDSNHSLYGVSQCNIQPFSVLLRKFPLIDAYKQLRKKKI